MALAEKALKHDVRDGLRRTVRRRVADRGTAWILRRLAIALLVAVFVFPFLVMATTAFKNVDDIFHAPPRLLPEKWDVGEFSRRVRADPAVALPLQHPAALRAEHARHVVRMPSSGLRAVEDSLARTAADAPHGSGRQ